MSCLSVEHLTIATAQKTLVENISFTVESGKTLALVGESGSGKSLTALSILQLLPEALTFTAGKIHFQQQDLCQASPNQLRALRGNQIGMIFQEPMTSLNPLHTVEQQIGESLLQHSNLRGKALRHRVLELLERVGITDAEKRLHALPHALSGGQRQRVMIAMALANHPQLLIADEPTTALDVTVQAQILSLLKELQQDLQMSMLFISHDLNVVQHMADTICVMRQGRILEYNSTENLFSRPQQRYTQELLAAANQQGEPVTLADPAPVLLRAQNLSVTFGHGKQEITALKPLSCEVMRGETLGIVGESGSGKTTLGLALLQLRHYQGNVGYLGRNTQGEALETLKGAQLRSLRKDLQIVFQDPFGSLNPRFTVEQIVAEGLKVHQPHLSAAQRRERVAEVLQQTGMAPEIMDRYPHEFSGGQRQRISIARAIVLQPQLLILDEPTSALDVTIQQQIIDLLRELQREQQLTYLLISHDLRVVRSLAHRILVLKNGELVESGSATQIFQNPQQPYTQALLRAAMG